MRVEIWWPIGHCESCGWPTFRELRPLGGGRVSEKSARRFRHLSCQEPRFSLETSRMPLGRSQTAQDPR